jgi:hypothetical protein
LYPNWTRAQQKKSRILHYLKKAKHQRWRAYYVDVQEDGVFLARQSSYVDESLRTQNEQWRFMTEKVRYLQDQLASIGDLLMIMAETAEINGSCCLYQLLGRLCHADVRNSI